MSASRDISYGGAIAYAIYKPHHLVTCHIPSRTANEKTSVIYAMVQNRQNKVSNEQTEKLGKCQVFSYNWSN